MHLANKEIEKVYVTKKRIFFHFIIFENGKNEKKTR
jgi:hypothetical protein